MPPLGQGRRSAGTSHACSFALLSCVLAACAPGSGAAKRGEEPRTAPRDPAPARPSGTDPADKMSLHFIDVGQGDATLIEFPCGVVIVDTGGESNEAFDGAKAFRDYVDGFFAARPDRPRRIDALVITHPHIDHTRSVEWLLENYEVANVVHNGQVVADDPGSPPQEAMVAYAESKPEVGALRVMAADVPAPEGLSSEVLDPVGACDAAATDPKITALWGRVIDTDQTYGENPNDHSVVLRVDYGDSSILFTGDLQMMGLARMSDHFAANPGIFDVDIYQVGHHGSHNATKDYFVDLMSPELAVVSMGPYERDLDWTARRYGHPHRRAMGPLLRSPGGVRLAREPAVDVMLGVRGAWEETPSEFEPRHIEAGIYATGWDGTVVIDAYANGWLDVHTER